LGRAGGVGSCRDIMKWWSVPALLRRMEAGTGVERRPRACRLQGGGVRSALLSRQKGPMCHC
jgi:hypothetical protein